MTTDELKNKLGKLASELDRADVGSGQGRVDWKEDSQKVWQLREDLENALLALENFDVDGVDLDNVQTWR
jgi:hypothetical protein